LTNNTPVIEQAAHRSHWRWSKHYLFSSLLNGYEICIEYSGHKRLVNSPTKAVIMEAY